MSRSCSSRLVLLVGGEVDAREHVADVADVAGQGMLLEHGQAVVDGLVEAVAAAEHLDAEDAEPQAIGVAGQLDGLVGFLDGFVVLAELHQGGGQLGAEQHQVGGLGLVQPLAGELDDFGVLAAGR